MKTLIASGVSIFVALAAACTDPVRDARIDALPPEDANGPGPEHRAGQACLLCHSEGGRASTHFSVAGTVWVDESPRAAGKPGVIVRFVDDEGGGPPIDPVTNAAGNFFVRAEDWEPTYPFKVGLYEPGSAEPIQRMRTTVNREGSCNFCHRKNPATLNRDEIDIQKTTVGQIYARAGQ